MSEPLTKARFFIESKVQAQMVQQYENESKHDFPEHSDFGFDIIDQPFFCAISSGDVNIDIKLYIRSEMGAFLEKPDVAVTLFTNGEKPKATANTRRLGGDIGKTVMMFFKTAVILVQELAAKNLIDAYSDMNTDEEGVFVLLENDAYSFRRAEGKDRPNMACTTLFGGVQMMRPYQNEILDSWMDEMLPLDEKIELAENGDEDMMEQLAMAYLNGDDDVEAEPEKAVYWFSKLAELGHSDAQFNLGLHCAKGFGVERSFEKALYWMEKAAENGDEDAPAMIKKLQKAAEAEKTVSSGDAQAQADLASAYMFLGNSLEQADPEEDYKLALDLAQKSAEQNNGDGIWALALCYEHGRGTGKDAKKAAELYQRAAALGHARALNSLGCYYLLGEAVPQNMKMGFELVLRSSLLGDAEGMSNLGRCYQFGNGCMGNMKKAIQWYKKSLEILPNPELERKVSVFEMMPDAEEDETYFGEDSDRTLTEEEAAFLAKVDASLPDEAKEAAKKG